ncbi:MAG: AAA family ATPase, partial [Micromonosporaceae bacterium]
MGTHWPLVGRTELLTHIGQTLTDAPRGVVLAGASGVGKTRLAREALSVLDRRSHRTTWITATTGTRAIPLGALSHLLPGEPPVATDRLALLRVGAAALARTNGDGGTPIVGVDDAHLLDETSAALLHHLAAQRRAVVVATVRDDVPVPAAITMLWKDDLAERIDVPPLDLEGVRQLADAALGDQLDQTSLRRLLRDTGGNPLYLRELLAAGHPLFRGYDGVWQYRGSPAGLPRIVELVESRIGELAAREREALELVALGEPLELGFLGSLADDSAAELERRGLLDVQVTDGRWSAGLAHPLYGEVVRSRMPRLRSRAVRRRLAEALAAT